MKIRLLQALFALLVGCSMSLQLSAQSAVISGKVTSQAGEAIPGVSILIKGTSSGTTTDATGAYSLTTTTRNATLIFSAIGFLSEEITVGNRSVIDVFLKEDNKMLNEVIVTALGIKREEKSLGYAAQTINENAVKDAKSNNWVNTLSGKVAGLNIQGAGAGPMGSARITLRGESSLNLDNNQALIVVDGVPVSSRITGTGFNSHLSADSPVDYGSSLSDINPDDIEKVTVLKGPGATALYGSRAAGGAIIITTKSGVRQDKGIGVTVNSNFSFERINRYPDYQFEYGEGRSGAYFSYLDSEDGPNTATTVAAGRAWGPKFDGQMYYQFNPDAADGRPTVRTPWVANKDYISGFFQTGTTFSNSVSVEGGGENGSARLSVTHLKNKWIIPNTGFERLNAALSVNQRVSKRLKINGKANYTNKKSDNLPLAGYNNQSLMYFLILGTTPNIKPEWFKPYWEPGLENVKQRAPFNPTPDNPYLGMYEMLNKMNKHGFIGNVSANYEISPKLDVLVRTGLDMAFEFRSQQRPFSMTRFPRGSYREQNVFTYESNTDFLLNYKDKIANLIDFTASVGGNAMRQSYDFAGMYADQLAQPGIYQISNSLDQAVADPLKTKKAINSVYAASQFSWDEKIFLDVTGRNDWSSTLPYGNNSFFYPSLSSSFLLNELFTLPKAISFAKFRASWAQVGNDTRPYQTARYYDRVYGNSFTNSNTLFNADLKPEITASYEFGLDVRLLRNLVGLDVAYYNNNSRNQILAIPLDPVSGYNNALINAGLINSRGVELKLTGKPVTTKNFSWNTTLLWSRNRSYVRELASGITNQVIYAHNTNVSIEARVGGLMGDMYGRGFQRAPDGQIIYSSVGLPAALDPTNKKWGNAFADWKASLSNEFTIRNVRVSLLLDGQKGGEMYSQTNHKNNTLGKTKVTLPGRDEGIIGQGVVKQPDGSFTPNTVKVPASSYYDNYYQIANAETNIFDASFLKIRELRIEFNLPQAVLSRIGVRQTSLAFFGRDLFNFTKFPGFDPEGGNLNNGTLTPGVELAQFPSTRTMGMNLTLKF
ncbi:SusC/RagA family TonB-linked outer membrane protein [Dyadobacter chenwenxiniae]|uniref:SusC/RagA family TonB-linked outer membrane protein n=1 Tax=Dyadobacter chenwenxiniae TaxID=2906456 RepID=A0A9X1TGM3_9BACT|nr:SusC/RagA family TonB-linked outer membrane protein [Dyadobacter chenwenxiniae]MCF0063774.1 SusC/RagA family TonB-linked outer membrane protein [Dyadobacter chenwenxiniae]UON83450.1 SusC/RagA family TonB-linked outer membrane protein [Dyadobacter chenwenxiniae]